MNQTFKKILAIQDAYRESIAAMEWANRLIAPNGHIKVLDVQPPLGAIWHEMFSNQLDASPVSHRQKSLGELVDAVDFSVDDVTSQVRSGTPVVQIVREAIKNNFDLVIKESHSKASDFIFGSLDMRLIRNCPSPIWLTHPGSSNDCSRILVALNPEAGAREMVLNKRLLTYASSVASGFDCELFVVAAYLTHQNSFPILDKDSLKKMDEHSKAARVKAREKLELLFEKCTRPIGREHVILQSGSPDEVILEAVAQVQPDLLVMGSVARHGMSGLMVGNAAERVLRQVSCSVLTIKPLNFVSPIAPEPDASNQGDLATGNFAC